MDDPRKCIMETLDFEPSSSTAGMCLDLLSDNSLKIKFDGQPVIVSELEEISDLKTAPEIIKKIMALKKLVHPSPEAGIVERIKEVEQNPKAKIKYFRPIRGDGDCFYCSTIYSYFELLIKQGAESAFIDLLRSCYISYCRLNIVKKQFIKLENNS